MVESMHVALLGTGNDDGICSRPLRLSFALFYPSSLGILGRSKSLLIPRSTVFPWSYILSLSFPTVKLLKAVVRAVPDQSSFRNGHWSHTLRSFLTSEPSFGILIFSSSKSTCSFTQGKKYAVCSSPDRSHDLPCPNLVADLQAIIETPSLIPLPASMSPTIAALSKTPKPLRQTQIRHFNDGFVRRALTQLDSAAIAKAMLREERVWKSTWKTGRRSGSALRKIRRVKQGVASLKCDDCVDQSDET